MMLFDQIAIFSLNTFFIAHLLNSHPYEIIYGQLPAALSDICIQSDCLIKPNFYHFTDYFDLLKERMSTIRQLVKTQHNAILQQYLKIGSDSPTLRTFNEGDMVYCNIQPPPY